MTAQQKYSLETKPVCVLADGPYETDGDGGFEYCVCFGDESGEPITENPKAVWHPWEFEETQSFAVKLARKYGLELVFEAMAA
jgi:hypothetical protein